MPSLQPHHIWHFIIQTIAAFTHAGLCIHIYIHIYIYIYIYSWHSLNHSSEAFPGLKFSGAFPGYLSIAFKKIKSWFIDWKKAINQVKIFLRIF